MWRAELAMKAAADLKCAQDAGMDINVIAHSNGCDVVVEALIANPNLKVANLHLIAAAIGSDCRENGLNGCAKLQQFERVTFYVSPADEALPLAIEPFYGDMGRRGPEYYDEFLFPRFEKVIRNCKHGDWVGAHFEETMSLIAKAIGA
jgi:esterase/lipase superfamily enzyme